MIKYRTESNKIEAMEVERETDKQVVLPAKNGYPSRRENKVSDWRNWHDTWEAAHAFLVANAQRDIDSLRKQLERANGKLGQIKGMTPNAELRPTGAGLSRPSALKRKLGANDWRKKWVCDEEDGNVQVVAGKSWDAQRPANRRCAR